MNWKCSWGFHDWTKWVPYTDHYIVTFAWGKSCNASKSGQRRSCNKCGFIQDIKRN